MVLKTNLAQIITLNWPNLAQIITSRHMYIYICCRVNNLATFGGFKGQLATYRSITWPPFFAYKNRFFLSFFSAQFSGVVQISVSKGCFWSKTGFSENGWCTFFGGFQGLGDCCCMMLLDALERCSKTIKFVFF